MNFKGFLGKGKKLFGASKKVPSKNVEPQEQPTGFAPINIGGGGGPWKTITIILLIIVAGVLIYFGFTYLWGASGAGQASSGGLFAISYNFNKFISSFGVRSMWWQITHPFEIQPTQAKEEQTNPKYQFLKSIRESLSVKVVVAPQQVQYGQRAMARITIQNLGTQDIKRYYILVLPAPGNEIINCLGDSLSKVKISPNLIERPVNCTYFGSPLDNYMYDKDICGKYSGVYGDNYSSFVSEETIIPGESKVYTLSNISVDSECGKGKKPEVPQAYPFFVRVATPYVAASRIPITFIDKNYQNLLFVQGLYKQYKVPATAMAGTAVKINIDAGTQPLSNDTTLLPVLFNFENMGSGKILGNPLMFLIIPSDFGHCSEEGYYACYDENYLNYLHDNKPDEYNGDMYVLKGLKDQFCGPNGVNSSLGGFAAKEMNWICDKMNQIYYATTCHNEHYGCDKYNGTVDYNICITIPKHEFQAYSCTLRPKINMHGEKRVTYYLTAFAVYNYEVEAPATVNAYTMGGS